MVLAKGDNVQRNNPDTNRYLRVRMIAGLSSRKAAETVLPNS
jgi:hypothetical protein